MHQYNKLDNASLNFPLCFVAFFPSAQGRFSQYFIPPVPQIMHAINAAVYLLKGFPRPFKLLFSQLEVFSVLPHQWVHTQLSALHTVHWTVYTVQRTLYNVNCIGGFSVYILTVNNSNK